MNTAPFTITLVVAVAAVTVALCGTSRADETEERVPYSEVPAAVKQTFEENCDINTATLGEVTRETEDGKVVYEAEAVRDDGSKIEIEVEEDGTLIEIEVDDEDEEVGDDDP